MPFIQHTTEENGLYIHLRMHCYSHTGIWNESCGLYMDKKLHVLSTLWVWSHYIKITAIYIHTNQTCVISFYPF